MPDKYFGSSLECGGEESERCSILRQKKMGRLFFSVYSFLKNNALCYRHIMTLLICNISVLINLLHG